MKLSSDLTELLVALNEAEARYLVIGGYAVSWHAEPRFTKDLDVWVSSSPDNAAKVYSALQKFGAPLNDLTVQDLETPGMVFQIGVPPTRVDILTEISGGVDFDEAYAQRVEGAFGAVRVSVVGLEALIRNKKATGRPQDVRDVRQLERVLARGEKR